MKTGKAANMIFALAILITNNYHALSQKFPSTVRVAGAMKNVMWKGQLNAAIDIDTIADKQHLYGLGPLEFLKGEILVIDGKAYRSAVLNNTTMKVEESFKSRAPFFVYANIDRWVGQVLPDSIRTIPELELYLDQITKTAKRPFVFKISGMAETATIHVVNLPEGTKVSSPGQAHQGETNFSITNELVQIIGFFSTEHQSIFTHHDTFLHMHLITGKLDKMGHLDAVKFRTGTMTLYLPAE